MTRTPAWLAALSCAVLLACFSQGCGGDGPGGGGKGGNGGSKAGNTGSSGNAGSTAGSTAGTTGMAGDTGNAGSTAGTGGSTAGTGGGTAGTTAGTGGGTAGTTDAGSDAKDGSSDSTDAKSDTTEAGPAPICGDGNRCNESGLTCETACTRGRKSFCLCYDPAGGAARLEYSCFMDVACTSPDAGTDAGTDAGSTDGGNGDGGVPKTCAANTATGGTCSVDAGATMCVTACTNTNRQRTCTCGRFGWICSTQHACL